LRVIHRIEASFQSRFGFRYIDERKNKLAGVVIKMHRHMRHRFLYSIHHTYRDFVLYPKSIPPGNLQATQFQPGT
jgi:hypothetical protein